MRIIFLWAFTLVITTQSLAASYTCQMQSTVMDMSEGEPIKLKGTDLPDGEFFLTVNDETLALSFPNQAPDIFNRLAIKNFTDGYFAHYSSDTVTGVKSVLLRSDENEKNVTVRMIEATSISLIIADLICPH